MLKLDWQHVGLFLAPLMPLAVAFVDYCANMPQHFSKETLQGAALATVMVGLSLAKQSFIVPAPPAPQPPVVH